MFCPQPSTSWYKNHRHVTGTQEAAAGKGAGRETRQLAAQSRDCGGRRRRNCGWVVVPPAQTKQPYGRLRPLFDRQGRENVWRLLVPALCRPEGVVWCVL